MTVEEDRTKARSYGALIKTVRIYLGENAPNERRGALTTQIERQEAETTIRNASSELRWLKSTEREVEPEDPNEAGKMHDWRESTPTRSTPGSPSRTDELAGRHAVTKVRMRRLGPAEIETYVRLSEGLGKAGGYAIQCRAASFVEWVGGDCTNVAGLPLVLTGRMLAGFGIDRY